MEIKDITGLGELSPIFLELYKDMAQPAARNVGLGLAAITSIGLFLHLLTSWGTEKLNICLKNNLEKYSDRIKDTPVEDISEVPPEIGIPIIEKLSYVTNEELRNLYVELLAKATIKEENDKAHPSFINIINSLSPDEALLLDFFKKNQSITPKHYFRDSLRKSEAFQMYLLEMHNNFIKLQFPNNLAGYLENFEGLGIIYITDSNTTQIEMFKDLESNIERNLHRAGANFQRVSLLSHSKLNSQRQSLYVTNYGKLFLDAVIESPSMQKRED